MGNVWHFLLLLLPNFFHPRKLVANLRHPIGEFIHTGHRQFKKNGENVWIVEHFFLGRKVTVDLITEDEFARGFLPRLARLFREDFYYGHGDYFPGVFRLLERNYCPAKTTLT